MSAFQFPNPNEGTTEAYNPDTGAHYVWKADPGKWVIVQAESADPGINEQVSENTERIGAIENDYTTTEEFNTINGRVTANEKAIKDIGDPVTYQIGTDKVMRAGDPSIELVDSEGYYSNVKFRGLNGIKVTSDLQAIIIDGADVAGDGGGGGGSDVDPENYYTKSQADGKESRLQTQIDELYVTKGSASEYVLQDVIFQPAVRPGHMYSDNTLVRAVGILSFAATDNNGLQRPLIQDEDIVEIVKSNGTSYRYKVKDETDGNLEVEWIGGNGDDLLMATMTFTVYVYPQNSTTASKEYVDAQDALKADKSELSQYVTTSDANRNYLKDGSTTSLLMINRTAGGTIDSMKVTNITGGATVWRLDCKAGSNGPVIYKTEGSGYHNFEGKVVFERLGNERNGLTIQGRNTDGDIDALLYVYHNGGSVADAVNYTGKITSPQNIATKKYVDDAVGTSAADAFTNDKNPPGRRFKFYNGTNPSNKQFTYYQSGSDVKLALARKDADDIKWLDVDFNDGLAAPVLFRITKKASETEHHTVRYGAIERISANNGGDVICTTRYHVTNGKLTDGEEYFITIGGFI